MLLHNKKITERIQILMDARGLRVRELARLIGMDHGNLSRLLANKRPWSLEHLRMVAPALDCSPTDLQPDERLVPIIAEVGESGEFVTMPSPKPLGYAALPTILGKGVRVAKEFYVIKLKEDREGFVEGSLLFVRRHAECKNKDFVVCSRESGRYVLARLVVGEDETITLHRQGHEPTTLPATHIRLCDRVESIVFPLIP